MPSHYEQFRQSIGRDGPDYSIVESAVGRERDELEVELISNLDYFEALALGLLKSKAAFRTSSGCLPMDPMSSVQPAAEHFGTSKVIPNTSDLRSRSFTIGQQ